MFNVSVTDVYSRKDCSPVSVGNQICCSKQSTFALLIYIFVQNLKIVNNLPEHKGSNALNSANSI